MYTYIKLKSGAIMVVWSDNLEDENYDAYPLSKVNSFDVEVDFTTSVRYDEVINSDTNLGVLQ